MSKSPRNLEFAAQPSISPRSTLGVAIIELWIFRRRAKTSPMKRLLWLLAIAVGIKIPLLADTVYQTNSQGKQVVIQRDAIVVREDSNYVYYKHFDLKERRVEKVNLNKGSLPYQVSRSAAADRQQIVDVWKRFGYRVTVTDVAG